MANFPDYKPIYSASKKSEPKTRRIEFGDGYEQRRQLFLTVNQSMPSYRQLVN